MVRRFRIVVLLSIFVYLSVERVHADGPVLFLPFVGGIAPNQSVTFPLQGLAQLWNQPTIAETDTETGTTTTIAEDFCGFEDGFCHRNYYDNLAYTIMINLGSTHTARQIADGQIDNLIIAWAQDYKTWQIQTGKKALIALMQEMNGCWTSYGCDPENYKRAYWHIIDIFASVGTSQWWVFAPNNWSAPPYRIADYYPTRGDVSHPQIPDLLGYSAFNWGACQNQTWQSPAQISDEAIAELRALDPSNSIIWAQAGTSPNGGDESQWWRDAYAYARSKRLLAVIAFNANFSGQPGQCNWSINGVSGYAQAVHTVQHIPPNQFAKLIQ